MQNQLSKVGLIVLSLAFAASSCKPKHPDYPVVPYLEYKDMVKGNGTLILKFNFKDGDADIGSTPDEGNNFFYKIYQQVNNQWEILGDTAGYGYTVPYMDKDGHTKGYEGEIDVQIFAPFPANDFKYKWTIRDKAGHMSNEVETPVISPW